MMLVGFVVVGAALVVEILYQPPYWWLHGVIWIPLILSFGMLRPIKGLMIATQYHNQAREGQLDESDA